MSFINYNLNVSYKSVGEDTISDVINPLLSETKVYKRSVGFFSSSALNFISDGVINLAKNGGHIYLATSPKLSDVDIEAIRNGYEKRAIYEKWFIHEFTAVINSLNNESLNLLSDLIAEGVLDIRIVKKIDGGMYHDKLAILTDFDGNTLVFQGSNNESGNGYFGNYEKVRVYKSWFDYEGRIADETDEFEGIWSKKNAFLEVYEFNEAIKKSILEVKKNKRDNNEVESFTLREYQENARDSWIKNGYKGFFVMATGTGKTITSLFSIKELINKKEVFTVIAVPYMHLVNQWFEDAQKILKDCFLIKAYSEISNWDNHIIDSIHYNKYNKRKNIVVISTIKSFSLPKFDNILLSVKCEKLLVVDEAHNFINKINEAKYNYEYKLGLSATPIFGKDSQKTKELLDFFGGLVYNLPIEDAIGKFLVHYEYHPIISYAAEEEEKNFSNYNNVMRSCFNENGELIDKNKFTIAYRARLRVISMASEKINNLGKYIKKMNAKDHFIVYCSDGKIYDNSGDEQNHIRYVLEILNKNGYKPSKFTASETMDERMRLINGFNNGYINSLVAIRCLDEGINIPSIESALILSSNDNYREFVQRRGRILRKYEGKKIAHIYDVIVLPRGNCKGMAEIELRRYNEYAKLASNRKQDMLMDKLSSYLSEYDLSYEDIIFKNDYLEGGDLDD